MREEEDYTDKRACPPGQRAQPGQSQESPALSFSDGLASLAHLTLDERSFSQSTAGEAKKQLFMPKGKKIQRKHSKKMAGSKTGNQKRSKLLQKIELQRSKIIELESQLRSVQQKRLICPNCEYNISSDIRKMYSQLILTQQPMNCALPSGYNRNSSQSPMQFQKIDFFTPYSNMPQMQQKAWIFLGTMLIVMGSKIMDVDGTLNTFRVLKESVDKIRRQVQKSNKKIQLEFYMLKQELFLDDDIDLFLYKPLSNNGLQLEGVKIEAINQTEVNQYDCKVNFRVHYESLLKIMQYARQHMKIA